MSFHKKLLVKALKAKGIPVEPELWDLEYIKTVCKNHNIDPQKIINDNASKKKK